MRACDASTAFTGQRCDEDMPRGFARLHGGVRPQRSYTFDRIRRPGILPAGHRWQDPLARESAVPGMTGKPHWLADYASSRVRAIVFTCNHCPTAQLYEERLRKLD